jgi:uncharacterized protein (TIGR03083 family)
MRIPDPDDAALAALDALGDDGRDLDPVTETGALGFAETVSALAEAASSPPVLGLRGRLLASAFAERAPGASIDDGGSDTASVALLRTVRDLDRLLATLDETDWTEVAHPALGSVRDVVAHLLAIEHLVLRQLPDPPLAAGWSRPASPPGAPDDGVRDGTPVPHVAYAAPVVAATADLPIGELRRRWRTTAEAVGTAAGAAPADARLDLHGLHVGVEGGIFLRTFELWAHLDDIARATGRRRPRLDARRLRAMSAALVDALPIAVTLAGHGDIDARVRLVLTGPGGGSYDVVLGRPSGTDEDITVTVTVTVDVVDLCRVAAQRAELDRIDVRVAGSGPVAAAVLGSVSVFAMD